MEEPCTAEAWDARVTRLSQKLPPKGRIWVAWLREPSRKPMRLVAAGLLVVGGILSILPVLGVWMLPLGLALLAQDVPALKVPLEYSARRIARSWERLRWRGKS